MKNIFSNQKDEIYECYKRIFQLYYKFLYSPENKDKYSKKNNLEYFIRERNIDKLLFFIHDAIAKMINYKILPSNNGNINYINFNKREIIYSNKFKNLKEKLLILSVLMARVLVSSESDSNILSAIYFSDLLIQKRYEDDREVKILSNLLMFSPIIAVSLFNEMCANEYIKILINEIGFRPQFLYKLLKMYQEHNIMSYIITTFYMEDLQNSLI